MTRKKQKHWLNRPKPYHRRKNIGRAYVDKFGLLQGGKVLKVLLKLSIYQVRSTIQHRPKPAGHSHEGSYREWQHLVVIYFPLLILWWKLVNTSNFRQHQTSNLLSRFYWTVRTRKRTALFKSLKSKLRSSAHYDDFLQFMKSVNDEIFPLQNLAFGLFMETIRFFSTGQHIWNEKFGRNETVLENLLMNFLKTWTTQSSSVSSLSNRICSGDWTFDVGENLTCLPTSTTIWGGENILLRGVVTHDNFPSLWMSWFWPVLNSASYLIWEYRQF